MLTLKNVFTRDPNVLRNIFRRNIGVVLLVCLGKLLVSRTFDSSLPGPFFTRVTRGNGFVLCFRY